MNARVIKKLNENMPDIAKRVFSSAIRKKLTGNAVFLEQYRELEEYDTLPEAAKREFQNKKLMELLNFAEKEVPVYTSLAGASDRSDQSRAAQEEIKRFPIVTKRDLKTDIEKFLSKSEIDTYSAQTGGTTGDPLKIVLDRVSIYREKAFIYHHWSKLGYDYSSSKIITFRGVDVKNKFYKYNPIYNEIIVSPFYLNNQSIDKYIMLIDKFQPEFFQGYPSAIKNLCRILKEEKVQLRKPLKGVFFISEEVRREDKEYIENVLNCKTLSFYGHSERAVFAEETADGYYEFNSLYGYTELIPAEDENEFKIIATGFLNKKMPLIRYDTGDIAVFDGFGMRIKGRSYNQHLVGKNKEKISLASKVFHDGTFGKLAKYQFYQEAPGAVEIRILDKKLDTQQNQLEQFLQKKFNGVIDFTIKPVENLELTQRGKEKILIQKIKEV